MHAPKWLKFGTSFSFYSEINHVFQKYVKWLPSAVAKPDNFNDLVFSVLLYLMEAVDPEKISY